MFEGNKYEEDVKSFKKVLSTQADELLANEDKAVVYIGRSTCPFCRRFASKLSALADKVDTTIYYVNSEDYSDKDVNKFRNKYNIVTVPGFIVHKNGETEVRCDSSLPESEILDLVK
ncbi:thioredoxin domain-containing protein [Clostridium sp. HCS.1]|uniref:thioredoxin domain-containing protein n=1 Tax=Clostridium sp. HCS.1 TaxID=3238594 RepID=UPI003A0FE4E4